MFKAGETTKKKFMVKHARAMLIIVSGCKPKNSAAKKLLLKELVAHMEENPDGIDEMMHLLQQWLLELLECNQHQL